MTTTNDQATGARVRAARGIAARVAVAALATLLVASPAAAASGSVSATGVPGQVSGFASTANFAAGWNATKGTTAWTITNLYSRGTLLDGRSCTATACAKGIRYISIATFKDAYGVVKASNTIPNTSYCGPAFGVGSNDLAWTGCKSSTSVPLSVRTITIDWQIQVYQAVPSAPNGGYWIAVWKATRSATLA